MAVHAADVVLEVLRAQEIRVLLAEFVAAQATLGRFLPPQGVQADNLGWIAGLGVLFARAVTSFAALPFLSSMFRKRRLPVRTLVIPFRYILMAGLAGFGADILRCVHGRMVSGFGRFLLFGLAGLS